MMVHNGKGELEDFENDFQPGTPVAAILQATSTSTSAVTPAR